MALVIPAIEGANDRDRLSVGRPYREIRAFGAVLRKGVGAQPFVQLDVAAFVKQVEVVIAEQRHWRVPWRLRPSFGFARGLAGRGGASWAALYWLLGHLAEESPPRDLRD